MACWTHAFDPAGRMPRRSASPTQRASDRTIACASRELYRPQRVVSLLRVVPDQVEVSDVSVRIGSAKDVTEGQMRVFDVAGTKVNVARTNGRLYAFDDTCTHMGCSLAKGHLAGTIVTCSCHGSQFDVTSGAVLRGPAERPVRSRAVQVKGDDLLTEA